MSQTAQLITIAGGILTLVCALGTAVAWLVWPRFMNAISRELTPTKNQVTEIHKQVTENSHANAQPTLLDLLADIRDDFNTGLAKVDKRIDDHLLLAARDDAAMWNAIKAVAEGKPPEGI